MAAPAITGTAQVGQTLTGSNGTIAGGMIPKTETALQALAEGVRAVVILDGRVPHASLLELFTEQGAGSLIRSTEPRVKPHGLRQGGSGL